MLWVNLEAIQTIGFGQDTLAIFPCLESMPMQINEPAEISDDNVPYQAARALDIAIDGERK